MKKNNAIALIGYIAVVIAPLWGIMGVIMAIILICKGARVRQGMGVLITGLISYLLFVSFYNPNDLIYALWIPMLLTSTIGFIFYIFTREEK